MTFRKYRCPACREKTGVDILYGRPSYEAFVAAERKEIAIGGCCLDLDGSERQFTGCGHQWRVKHRDRPIE